MVLAATLIALQAGPLRAADVAQLEVWGFGADAPVFVFEEFGCQDGSGFGYSSIYAIDLEADRWLPGSPVRARIETETCDVQEARARAAEAASDVVPRRAELVPAEVLAFRARSDARADPSRLTFRWPTLPGPDVDGPTWSARLTQHPVDDAPGCFGLGDAALGFEVTLAPPGGEPAVIHRDEAIPETRGCPLHYALTAAYAPASFGHLIRGPVFGALLVSYYAIGFEGADRRFLALPVDLTAPAP